jgi:hypothetical protein
VGPAIARDRKRLLKPPASVSSKQPGGSAFVNRLNEIAGKRGITADTALRLSRLLKTSPQLWMRLQADWDLHRAMLRETRKAS